MSNPFVNQVVSAVHGGENNIGHFGAQVGAVAQDGAQVAAGHTSVPLILKNGTARPIWVAIHANFDNLSMSTRAWYEIQPGQEATVGNMFTSAFYYNANNDQGEIWSGPTSFGNFSDGSGAINSGKTFAFQQLPNNWLTFSSYTFTFNA